RIQARTRSAGLFIFLIERTRLGLYGPRLHLLRRARTRHRLLRHTLCWLLCIGLRFEYRATTAGELRRVLPQAGHDPADVRDLVAAETPDVGRAGHLLFPGSAVLLRRRGSDNSCSGNRDGKAEDNPLRTHG